MYGFWKAAVTAKVLQDPLHKKTMLYISKHMAISVLHLSLFQEPFIKFCPNCFHCCHIFLWALYLFLHCTDGWFCFISSLKYVSFFFSFLFLPLPPATNRPRFISTVTSVVPLVVQFHLGGKAQEIVYYSPSWGGWHLNSL